MFRDFSTNLLFGDIPFSISKLKQLEFLYVILPLAFVCSICLYWRFLGVNCFIFWLMQEPQE